MKTISEKLLTSVTEFGEQIEYVRVIYISGNTILGKSYLSHRADPKLLKRLRLENELNR